MTDKKRKKITLAQLRPTATRMYIKDPLTDEETEAWFDLIGQDSKEYRAATAALFLSRKKSNKSPTFDELYIENTKLIAATVKDWNEEIFGEFSHKEAVELLGDPELAAMREQVDLFSEHRRNFFRRS
tara:strand:- start:7915 stop:8298 length:384 start_codon:yes stop_codon:yes gene_type:complete